MDKLNRIAVRSNDTKELERRLYADAREGKLPTWRLDERKGTRFTHTTKGEQWEGEAWLLMRPDPRDARVVHFVLEPPDGKPWIEKEGAEGVYLGRFVEVLVNRFYDLVASIEVTRG